jgi:hypothetical protein
MLRYNVKWTHKSGPTVLVDRNQRWILLTTNKDCLSSLIIQTSNEGPGSCVLWDVTLTQSKCNKRVAKGVLCMTWVQGVFASKPRPGTGWPEWPELSEWRFPFPPGAWQFFFVPTGSRPALQTTYPLLVPWLRIHGYLRALPPQQSHDSSPCGAHND